MNAIVSVEPEGFNAVCFGTLESLSLMVLLTAKVVAGVDSEVDSISSIA